MNNRNIFLVILIVLSLGIVAYMHFGGHENTKQNRRDLAGELAAWITKEAAAGTKGRLLILAPAATSRDPFPRQLARRLESQMRDAGFAPVAVEQVAYNPQLESTGEPVTREKFLDLLRAHADCATVISLVGIPNLDEADLPAQNRPRIIVASTVIMPYLQSLPRGLIDFAIEIKRDPSHDHRADPPLGELANYFVLYRPE